MTNTTKLILAKALIGMSLVTPLWAVHEEQGESEKRPVFTYKPPVDAVLDLRNYEDILIDFEEEIAKQQLALKSKKVSQQSKSSKR